MSAEQSIDTADHVHHKLSGEDWVVAYVRDSRLVWCGWPEGDAQLSDCTLIRKATPEQRLALLREMSQSGLGSRSRYAQSALATPPEPSPSTLPVSPEPSEAMVTAYLTANDAYWRECDSIAPPIGRWRAGTSREATKVSLRAALAAAPRPEGTK